MAVAVRAVAGLVERMLAADGPLPALGEEQRRLARIVAEALDAPPAETALITLTQAATGTGKSVALLAPVMALAALQKHQGVPCTSRAALSTCTHHLARQLLADDAPRVREALEALGLPAVSVATRAGRRQLIDGDRVERAIERLGQRCEGPARRALAAFDTFAEAEDHGVFVPAGVGADALCVTAKSSETAAAAFSSRRRAADAADVVLTTHALVLTDDARRACRSLAKLCAHETAGAAPRLLERCAARTAILGHVARLRDALEAVAASDDESAEEAALLAARLRLFLESVQGADHTVAAIAPGESPALVAVHRAPVRLLRRVFDTTDTTFLVRATLAAPAARPSPNDLLRALGIGPGARRPRRVNGAGWADLQPRRYGEMHFRFADRAVPAPIRYVDDVPASDPMHLDYVAGAIEAARTNGRVLTKEAVVKMGRCKAGFLGCTRGGIEPGSRPASGEGMGPSACAGALRPVHRIAVTREGVRHPVPDRCMLKYGIRRVVPATEESRR